LDDSTSLLTMYFQQKAVGHSTPHSLCPAVGITSHLKAQAA